MPFHITPGVYVREIDLSDLIPYGGRTEFEAGIVYTPFIPLEFVKMKFEVKRPEYKLPEELFRID